MMKVQWIRKDDVPPRGSDMVSLSPKRAGSYQLTFFQKTDAKLRKLWEGLPDRVKFGVNKDNTKVFISPANSDEDEITRAYSRPDETVSASTVIPPSIVEEVLDFPEGETPDELVRFKPRYDEKENSIYFDVTKPYQEG